MDFYIQIVALVLADVSQAMYSDICERATIKLTVHGPFYYGDNNIHTFSFCGPERPLIR